MSCVGPTVRLVISQNKCEEVFEVPLLRRPTQGGLSKRWATEKKFVESSKLTKVVFN